MSKSIQPRFRLMATAAFIGAAFLSVQIHVSVVASARPVSMKR
jgi:hypothetical protein